MSEIMLDIGDLVRLTSKEAVKVLEVSSNNTFTGVNKDTVVIFSTLDIDCYSKKNLKPCSDDNENYWMFYSGEFYNANIDTIANWARFNKPELFNDMSNDEIGHKHLYWATESTSYEGVYNGDTYVLFHAINKLPEDLKIDAEKNIN